MTLEALVARWGLLAVGVGAGLEGETAAVLGGLFAGQGYWPIWAGAVAAAAGSFAVDQGCFFLGRSGREHRWIRKLRGTQGYAKALTAFEKHPIGFIFAFRFLYGLRTVSPLAIGTSGIRTRTFLPANLAAACLWATIFTGIGFAFGAVFERWVGALRAELPWVLAGAAVVVAGGLIVRHVIGHHRPRAGSA